MKMNLWYLLFIIFFFIFLIESGKIRPNFDEIFGDGWDTKQSDEKLYVKIEQNENTGVDQMDGENGNGPNDQQKSEMIQKFDAIKERLREKGNFKNKDRCKIEWKIGKLLGANRKLIQKWKNELNLNKYKIKKQFYEQRKRNFIERIDEFKELYAQGKQKEFMKALGISKVTFLKWKKELMPNYHKKLYSKEDKLKKLKQYFKIKEKSPKISDKKIAEKLGISSVTLITWKHKFASMLNL